VVNLWQSVWSKNPPLASAVIAVTVTGAFTPNASITISPQLVDKLIILFLNGAFTSGGVTFFTVCPFALVLLQFNLKGLLLGAAVAFIIGNNDKTKIVKEKIVIFVLNIGFSLINKFVIPKKFGLLLIITIQL
jgi:hypothetical protein